MYYEVFLFDFYVSMCQSPGERRLMIDFGCFPIYFSHARKLTQLNERYEP